MVIERGIGVIEYITHPPIGQMTPRLDGFGPHSGNKTLTTWSSTLPPIVSVLPVSRSYGCIVQLEGALPPRWGFSQGWVSDDGQYEESRYFPPIAQVVTQHQFPTGSWVSTSVFEIDRFPTLVLWTEAFPGRIGLRVAPNLSVDLFFLVHVAEP
jgi:hypothetical protein